MLNRVQQSIQTLIKELGVACGADDKRYQSNLGRSVSCAVSSYTPSQIRREGKVGLPVMGGEIEIKFDSVEQPEAARLFDSVLDVVDKKHPLPYEMMRGENGKEEKRSRRRITPDFNDTGRKVVFAVPDDIASGFCDEVDRISHMLKRTSELKKQAHAAVDFSIKTVNQIQGAKPFVKITIPNQEGESAGAKPYFRLHIEGVPEVLATKLAEIMGIDKASFEPSDLRHGRDGRGDFVGGRTVDIPMNAGFTIAALETISGYVSVQDRIGNRPKMLPSGEPFDLGRGNLLPGH